MPGWVVVRELVKNEGAGAFFKGLTPKVCSISFMGWVGWWLIVWVDLGRGPEIGVQLYAGTVAYSLVRQLHLENLIDGSVFPLDEKYL